jgi:hypothetical protein
LPTYEFPEAFLREFTKLAPKERELFMDAVGALVAALRADPPVFPPRLRVKRVRGAKDVWELSWAADRRATFGYGEPRRPGHAHVVWRRIGGHGILRRP